MQFGDLKILQGLMPLIDMDAVDRQAWDKLGEPDEGESLKQVGKDPAREYQVHRVYRYCCQWHHHAPSLMNLPCPASSQ